MTEDPSSSSPSFVGSDDSHDCIIDIDALSSCSLAHLCLREHQRNARPHCIPCWCSCRLLTLLDGGAAYLLYIVGSQPRRQYCTAVYPTLSGARPQFGLLREFVFSFVWTANMGSLQLVANRLYDSPSLSLGCAVLWRRHHADDTRQRRRRHCGSGDRIRTAVVARIAGSDIVFGCFYCGIEWLSRHLHGLWTKLVHVHFVCPGTVGAAHACLHACWSWFIASYLLSTFVVIHGFIVHTTTQLEEWFLTRIIPLTKYGVVI